MSKTTHTIVIGNSKNMKRIEDESIHLHINSPPYWNIKDYGVKDQIGFNQSYKEYINSLNNVWDECYRTLHQGCKLCINIGDIYLSSEEYGKFMMFSPEVDIIKYCNSIGLDLINKIIWQKITNTNPSGEGKLMGSYPYPRNGIIKQDYEYILIFQKEGKSPKVSKKIKEKSRIPLSLWKEYFSGHWRITGTRQDEHIAMFPLEIPKRLITMYSFIGETICDCFVGSGTTTKASRMLNRNSYGYELNKTNLEKIKRKVGINQRTLNHETHFKIYIDVKEQSLLKTESIEKKVNGINYRELTKVRAKKIPKNSIIFSEECYKGEWCLRPYDRHPKGCPNYNKELCPPNTFYFKERVDEYDYFYLIYIVFDFKGYKDLRREEHKDWSEKQLGNRRHWQNSVKKVLKDEILKIYGLNRQNPIKYLLGCGSGFGNRSFKKYQDKVFSMEAVGINVLSTLGLNKINYKRNPENQINLICLLCSKEKIVLERKQLKINEMFSSQK